MQRGAAPYTPKAQRQYSQALSGDTDRTIRALTLFCKIYTTRVSDTVWSSSLDHPCISIMAMTIAVSATTTLSLVGVYPSVT